MRRNQEMLRKKLESQRDRGIIDDEQYRREVWEMRNMLEDVLRQLAQIEADAKVLVLETARDIAITAIPLGIVVKIGQRIYRVWRVGKFGPSIVWIGYREGTFFYRIGGQWYVRVSGRVFKIAEENPVPVRSIPVPSTPSVPIAPAKVAPGNCLQGACRSICEGWGSGIKTP